MAFDAHKNFAYSTVLTAPSPASSGTSLVVQSGNGANFPAAPFNITIWPAGALPTPANAEVARVTAISTDTLTITRAQEGSTARSILVGDQIAATVTAKTLTDVEGVASAAATITYGTWTPVDGTGGHMTFSSASGTYCQIGKLVFIMGQIVVSSMSGGAVPVYIGGLPFANGPQHAWLTFAGQVQAGAAFWIPGTLATIVMTVSNSSFTVVNTNSSTPPFLSLEFTCAYMTA